MKTYIGLIRGINVGGHNILKMADLRRLLEDLGYANPKTLLQSGNFVFQAEQGEPQTHLDKIQAAAAADLSVTAAFYVFDPKQLDDLIRNNPFPEAAVERPSKLGVYLGKEKVRRDALERLDGYRTAGERVQVVDGVVYLDCPNGFGTSKMLSSSPWCKLTSSGTLRNWNTVIKLRELASKQT